MRSSPESYRIVLEFERRIDFSAFRIPGQGTEMAVDAGHAGNDLTIEISLEESAGEGTVQAFLLSVESDALYMKLFTLNMYA